MAGERSPEEFGDFVHRVCNIAETIANLNYLIGLEAENPRAVRSYTDLIADRLQNLQELMRSTTTSL